jgi:haloacid dehalogenase-like hydrolase
VTSCITWSVAGVVRASPWFIGLLGGACDRGSAKAHFLAATLGGMTRHELEEAAQQYAAGRLPVLIRPEMVARIQEHKRCGHRLVLVSASPTLYLTHWAVGAGFDPVLATELEFRGERVSGHLASPNCWGPEKVRRLSQAPLGVVQLPGLCGWRHVIGHRATRSWRSLADMPCRQFVLVVKLHHGGGRLKPQIFTRKPERHGIVGALELHMCVAMDLHARPCTSEAAVHVPPTTGEGPATAIGR